MKSNNKTLIVVAGPTAVGKTAAGIELARHYHTEIISCDSRQFYSEMNIGTAKPDIQQLAAVKHHFTGHLSIHDYYNVSMYEQAVLQLLTGMFEIYPVVLMVGGSGLYIDAVCNGIDDFPDPAPELRSYLRGVLADEGIVKLQMMLQNLDPDYYTSVDRNNPSRLLRALEVCMTAGVKFSELRKNSRKNRYFNVLKIALNIPREQLFSQISFRVNSMLQAGLVDEARSLLPFRHLTALQTVGYRELFEYFDGKVTLEQAVENIKTHTRRYAKRQLTWLGRNNDYKWFNPDDLSEIINYIDLNIK